MFRKIVTTAAAATLLSATSSFAHHPGGGGNTGNAGPILTISATTLEQGTVQIGFLYEYISFTGLTNADLIAAAGRHEHAHSIGTIQSPSLGVAYGVTNDLTIAWRVPYVLRTDIREGHHSHGPAGDTVDFRGDSAGIGDATVLGQYRFFNNRTTGTEAAVLFGARLPTGRTTVHDAQGLLFETEFQPGSGAFDGLAGLAFTQRFGAWSFDTNVLYTFAGRGAQDTDLGDRFNYNAAVSYRLIGSALAPPLTTAQVHATTARPHRHNGRHSHDHHHHEEARAAPGWIVDLALELNGEWHDKQNVAGVRDPNSGGNVLYVAPGLRVGYGNVSGFVLAGFPIIADMYGLQSRPSFRALTGVAATF